VVASVLSLCAGTFVITDASARAEGTVPDADPGYGGWLGESGVDGRGVATHADPIAGELTRQARETSDP